MEEGWREEKEEEEKERVFLGSTRRKIRKSDVSASLAVSNHYWRRRGQVDGAGEGLGSPGSHLNVTREPQNVS